MPRAGFEPTHPYDYPDKMGGEGVEPSSLAAYGPEPYVFANFTTRPFYRDASPNSATAASIVV